MFAYNDCRFKPSFEGQRLYPRHSRRQSLQQWDVALLVHIVRSMGRDDRMPNPFGQLLIHTEARADTAAQQRTAHARGTPRGRVRLGPTPIRVGDHAAVTEIHPISAGSGTPGVGIGAPTHAQRTSPL